MVALSESVMKKCLKRPLAEKLPWRYIRLALKPCHLGNHASQIKSYYWSLSQAARQGLAVLMASAVAVQKHETSNLRKGTILYQLFSNLAWMITLGRSPTLTKLVQVRQALETRRGANEYGYCDFLFFYSSTELQPIPLNQFSRTMVQKTRSGVRKTHFGDEQCVNLKFGVFYPKNTPKIGCNGQLPAKIKCRITL